MPVNPHFNFVNFTNEQNLVEDLIVEAIQIYGHSAHYIPREEVNLDYLFGEDPLAHYTNAREIELYLKSNIHFGGQSDFISKFGLVIEDQVTFLVAQRRFQQELALIRARPIENDIIYIQFTPENRYLFEIRFVESKEQIFQLGKLYTYELQCELMNYSHERVQTNIAEANTVAEREAYTVEITMLSGNGSFQHGETVYQGASFLTATATGMVVNWNVAPKVLSVQNITGDFVGNVVVRGITSNAAFTTIATPDTLPTASLVSDNEEIAIEGPTIVIPQTNPRYN